MKLKKIIATTLATALIVTTPVNVFATNSSKVTSEFGTLKGTTTISLNGYEKRVNISMSTTKKAENYVIKYDVRMAGTGADITSDITLVNPNVSGCSARETVEMHHWRKDGYVNTKIIAYTTQEARGNTSACVYLSATY